MPEQADFPPDALEIGHGVRQRKRGAVQMGDEAGYALLVLFSQDLGSDEMVTFKYALSI